MKKTALTLSILSAFCSFAYAGPEQFSGKEMKQVAPPPSPTCPDWSGFYIGGFGGYKFTNADMNLHLFGEWNVRDIGTAQFIRDLEGLGSEDLDPSGAEAGGFMGYNMQFNKWVVGLEAAGAYLWADDSRNFDPALNSNVSIHTSLESHYLFTAGPRL